MNLDGFTKQGAIGDIHFGILSITGWDQLVEVFTTPAYFRNRVAGKILAEMRRRGVGPEKVITFSLPGSGRIYEITSDGKARLRLPSSP